MKLLLDQNLSFKLCPHLSDLFPEIQHVRMLGLSQASDREVWSSPAPTVSRSFRWMPILPI
jgi:predicted nuclease of predicted toxin-antitoxin system